MSDCCDRTHCEIALGFVCLVCFYIILSLTGTHIANPCHNGACLAGYVFGYIFSIIGFIITIFCLVGIYNNHYNDRECRRQFWIHFYCVIFFPISLIVLIGLHIKQVFYPNLKCCFTCVDNKKTCLAFAGVCGSYVCTEDVTD